ncbi:DUF72 domain-containing protein [Massilia sp. CCM 8733]|uniref:DUF72 domain-containing protein n=1 Tax=Massilia mucilaginosa TaxID=2609282 RepID=A0ABX0NYX0_9BURK|nr:DUF72 domain-containing protein [Massilia mucilaginosa]NHZ91811.1 DUF72 domain-containing protein [Massilia mucilaginosa]
MTSQRLPSGGVLRIGCAGWTISREAAPSFDAEGSHLERYARVLGTVEINSSFYRPHQPKTYARWAASVPPAFRFAVKMPRAITHDAGLAGIDAPLRQFAGEVGALGEKLGCLLVQLPPKFAFDGAVAGDFFARVNDTFGCMLACEARHPSWFGDAASALLERAGVTRVIADPAKGQHGPHVPTTQAIYVRLHGSPRIYYSAYSPAYIAQLARDMAVHAQQGRDVWIIFDNTASGAALPNALALRTALEPGPGLTPAPGPGLPA